MFVCLFVCAGIDSSIDRTESSSSQKLIVEHERYQDLQHERQRLQEDYENRLEAAEESKTQALEELTQRYEVPLQEKTRLVVQVGQEEQLGGGDRDSTSHQGGPSFDVEQCQEEAQQEIRMFKEIVKQVEEDEERIIHDVKVKYERKLLAEKKSNSNLKGEAGVMAQKVSGDVSSLSRLPVCLSCGCPSPLPIGR